jgi:hypothetical protein
MDSEMTALTAGAAIATVIIEPAVVTELPG